MAKVWADQPFQLLVIPGTEGVPTSSNPDVAFIAQDMANVHNLLIRGLNSIYLQCENVKEPKDQADLTQYVRSWGEGITHHHHGEERLFFPQFDAIAKAGGATESIMNANVEQHHLFEPGLEKLLDFTKEVQAGTRAYDGKELKAIIDEFAGILTQHLHDEIKTLLRLEPYDGKAIMRVTQEGTKEVVDGLDPWTILPMLFGSTDRKYPGSANFPNVPFFLPYLSGYIFWWKHRGVWRFNPCDVWGRPQPLPFA